MAPGVGFEPTRPVRATGCPVALVCGTQGPRLDRNETCSPLGYPGRITGIG